MRQTNSKGVKKPLAAASEIINQELRKTISSATGIVAKDVSKNTLAGLLSGVLTRLRDLGQLNKISSACRAALSLEDISGDIADADKTIERWTVRYLEKTAKEASYKEGLLVKVADGVHINWSKHPSEERSVAISEQENLRATGGSGL